MASLKGALFIFFPRNCVSCHATACLFSGRDQILTKTFVSFLFIYNLFFLTESIASPDEVINSSRHISADVEVRKANSDDGVVRAKRKNYKELRAR